MGVYDEIWQGQPDYDKKHKNDRTYESPHMDGRSMFFFSLLFGKLLKIICKICKNEAYPQLTWTNPP